MTDMTEHPGTDELMAWVDKEVTGPRAAEITAHVVGCAQCAHEAKQFVAASAAVKQWRVEPAPAIKVAQPKRRLVYWAAAAAVILGVLSTVRVQCAEEPTCEHPSLHFSFMPTSSGAGAPAASLTQMAFERDWNSRRHLQTGIPNGAAKVLVVMFIDWQCPACRAVHMSYLPVIDAINREKPGSVRVVTRDYPLNIRCNPNVPIEMHPAACEAAVAVRLAREKNKDTEMIDWLFARQPSLTPALVQQGLKEVAGVTDLPARYPAVIKEVAAEVDLGRRLEVGGTPTVFVNGVLARTAENALFSPQQFEMALRIELRK